MKMRQIGSLDVSVVGLGTNNFGTDFFGSGCDQATATSIIDAALDVGVNFIDTAEEYSTKTHIGSGRSEEFIGVALGRRRDQVVIATKFSPRVEGAPDERGAQRIVNAVEASLKRLGTDRIDLYQQHRPDPETPIDEILEALTRLVKEGKVREIGCSNFSVQMLDEARRVSQEGGLSRFVSLQNPYNVLDSGLQDEFVEACTRNEMMLLPCFPLASGLLTGKYRKNQPPPADSRFGARTVVTDHLQAQLAEPRKELTRQLEEYAQERGRTILELAISWLASQPMVASVMAGATRPEQVRANAAAASWQLAEEDFRAIAQITGETRTSA